MKEMEINSFRASFCSGDDYNAEKVESGLGFKTLVCGLDWAKKSKENYLMLSFLIKVDGVPYNPVFRLREGDLDAFVNCDKPFSLKNDNYLAVPCLLRKNKYGVISFLSFAGICVISATKGVKA